jgi:hypothetical protein
MGFAKITEIVKSQRLKPCPWVCNTLTKEQYGFQDGESNE